MSEEKLAPWLTGDISCQPPVNEDEILADTEIKPALKAVKDFAEKTGNRDALKQMSALEHRQEVITEQHAIKNKHLVQRIAPLIGIAIFIIILIILFI